MTAYEKVTAARDSNKLTSVDYIAKMFGDSFVELHGDRRFSDDKAIVAGLAMLHGMPVTVIGLEKGRNTKERMELLASTSIADWTESHLNTVMEIFGMKAPEGATKEDKWELIMMFLKTKEAADIAELGHRVFTDAKDEVKEFAEEELERLSDLTAYVKVCGENVAEE